MTGRPGRAGGDGAARLVAALAEWGETARRDLPWRSTRDPWAVLVSEAMLQQTQVGRVIGPWRRFVDRFPDATACAAAPRGEVIALWAGLGYNRRAVQLHGAAGVICTRHHGQVPDRLADLLELPGVGPYTARAVLAFAFERDTGVVDTNAARVLARAVAGRALDRVEAQNLADGIVPPGRAWPHNQAMLDLGATYCSTRRPACLRCPVAASCAWAAAGHPGPDPAIGSAGTTGRQSTFAGSDRQGRGRLVAALRLAPVAPDRLDVAMGWTGEVDRAERVAAGLVAEGLAWWRGDGFLTLPGV